MTIHMHVEEPGHDKLAVLRGGIHRFKVAVYIRAKLVKDVT